MNIIYRSKYDLEEAEREAEGNQSNQYAVQRTCISLQERRTNKNSVYDNSIFKVCDKMERYVHVTEDEKSKEVERIESALKIVWKIV